MDTNYIYGKLRKDYGSQCRFSKFGPTCLENLMPDFSYEYEWILKNPVNKGTVKVIKWSEHEANTENVKHNYRGIFHVEGGWPKDVNLDDPDIVARYRKKAEKEESYLQGITRMSSAIEHSVRQNNAIDIYQIYFRDSSCRDNMKTLNPNYRTVGIMSDPYKPSRPVQHVSWSSDQGTLLAISYVNTEFNPGNSDDSPDSYIFDLEDSTRPFFAIESPCSIVVLEFNHRETQFVAGGLTSGQVAFWDIRTSSTNVGISSKRNSHRYPVSSLRWTHSKTSTEFYTGSSDGQVLWWDARKLTAPLEVLTLDLLRNDNVDEPQWVKWTRSHGVSCLDYDASIPVRFMVGTETGLVFNGNRKGKTITEKITGNYRCHYGPVYSTQRNPVFLKNFLTVGDWQIKIWSEDVKESPIIWTKHHDVKLNDGVWSESKPSVFYTVRSDGRMDCWDILQKQNEPILSIKVADSVINCVRCHEGGALLAVGDDWGKTYVIQMNDWFVNPDKNEKMQLASMFERETRREKIIEGKKRELRLKGKPAMLNTKDKNSRLAKIEAQLLLEVENEFMELIDVNNNEQFYVEHEQETIDNEYELDDDNANIYE